MQVANIKLGVVYDIYRCTSINHYPYTYSDERQKLLFPDINNDLQSETKPVKGSPLPPLRPYPCFYFESWTPCTQSRLYSSVHCVPRWTPGTPPPAPLRPRWTTSACRTSWRVSGATRGTPGGIASTLGCSPWTGNRWGRCSGNAPTPRTRRISCSTRATSRSPVRFCFSSAARRPSLRFPPPCPTHPSRC